jgi:hypothetical protein
VGNVDMSTPRGKQQPGFFHATGGRDNLWTLWIDGFKFVQTVHNYFGLNWRRGRVTSTSVDIVDKWTTQK